MSQDSPSNEPNPHGQPLRAFTEPGYEPLCRDLAEVRANIDRLDNELVRLVAERAMYVKDAARFKRDAYQVSAPDRQAEVFNKVRALAQKHDRGFDGLEEVVDATWRAMVAAFIANEQKYFNHMIDIEEKP